jgi:RimJ/RimL family protein N-acetyltransferase
VARKVRYRLCPQYLRQFAEDAAQCYAVSAMARPSPPLSTRHIRLRAIEGADYAWLHAVSCNDELALAWRFRGATPSPDNFVRGLWDGVLAQFLVVGQRAPHRPIGHVAAYNPDLQSGTVYFAVTAFPPYLGTGLALEGGLVFLNYLFSTWRLRKVYVETTEEALTQYKSAQRFLREEGRLIEHEYLKGHYVDRLTLALYRADFREAVERASALLTPTFEAALL